MKPTTITVTNPRTKGGVLQVIGNINFSEKWFSGRDTRGDTTTFCNYLADP